MKFNYILLSGLLFALGSFCQEKQNFTDATGLKQGFWIKRQPGGNPVYEGFFLDNKPVGQWKRYHDAGGLKALIHYISGSDSAMAILYDVSGKIIARGIYLNEKRTGVWILLSGDRKVAEESYLDGQKNGLSRSYYQSGELFGETEWKNGQQHGKSRFFFKEGKPYLEMMYASGKRNGYCISYFQNGAMEMESVYKDDLKEGDWKYYDNEGNLLYILRYSRGVIQNPGVLDSLESVRFRGLDLNRGKIPDPEDFLDNPSEYMMQMQNGK